MRAKYLLTYYRTESSISELLTLNNVLFICKKIINNLLIKFNFKKISILFNNSSRKVTHITYLYQWWQRIKRKRTLNMRSLQVMSIVKEKFINVLTKVSVQKIIKRIFRLFFLAGYVMVYLLHFI